MENLTFGRCSNLNRELYYLKDFNEFRCLDPLNSREYIEFYAGQIEKCRIFDFTEEAPFNDKYGIHYKKFNRHEIICGEKNVKEYLNAKFTPSWDGYECLSFFKEKK